MTPGQRMLSEVVAMLGSRIIVLVTRIGIAIILARTLGPDGFGTVSYAMSVVFVLTCLCNLGLTRPVLREASRRDQGSPALYRSALRISLASSALAMFGAMLIDMMEHGRPGALTLMAPMLVFSTAQLLVPWYQGQQMLRGVAYRQGMASAGTLSLVVLLHLSGGASVESYALAMTLETAISAWILVRHHPGFSSRAGDEAPITPMQRRKLLAEAWPYLLNDIVFLSMVRIDQIIIGHIADDASVGFYAIAVRITELTSLAPILIATAFAPVLSRAREVDEAHARLLLQKVYSIALLAGLFCSMALFLLREPGVRLLFGEAFLPSAAVVAIHVWACAPAFLTAIRSQWITVHAAQRAFLVAGVLAAVTQLALVWVLVPAIGITGAAWAYLWGSLVNLLLGPLLLGGVAREHTLDLLAGLHPRRWLPALRWSFGVLRRRGQSIHTA